jgi:hypothetical protein
LSPAAIIASYVTYPYQPAHLALLAVEALNAFAILQVQYMLRCGSASCTIFCWFVQAVQCGSLARTNTKSDQELRM